MPANRRPFGEMGPWDDPRGAMGLVVVPSLDARYTLSAATSAVPLMAAIKIASATLSLASSTFEGKSPKFSAISAHA